MKAVRLILVLTLISVFSVSAFSSPWISRSEMANLSDLSVCEYYNFDSTWRIAKDEMKRRDMSRDTCIDLLSSASAGQGYTEVIYYDMPMDDYYWDEWDSDYIIIDSY